MTNANHHISAVQQGARPDDPDQGIGRLTPRETDFGRRKAIGYSLLGAFAISAALWTFIFMAITWVL